MEEHQENMEKKISVAVIRRLPKYYRYLTELINQKVERISSGELSRGLGITASQIRQDLNQFGGFGQQGYGYNVAFLQKQIGEILGLGKTYSMVIIGAGNLGRAICNHQNFDRRGFHILGLFDTNKALHGQSVNHVPIYPMEMLQEFVAENHVDIAALCIPSMHAEEIAVLLADHGIRGIWNFSSIQLHLPKEVKVENVHLTESLMTLSYAISEQERKNTAKE